MHAKFQIRNTLSRSARKAGYFVKSLSFLKRALTPTMKTVLFLSMCAALSAQFDNITAQAPPGSASTSISIVLSVFMWFFGITGFVLAAFGLIKAMKHPGEHLPGVLAVGGIMIAGSMLAGLLKLIYHPGS
jgi:hypothetical protein